MGRLRSNCRWPDNKRFFSTLERIPKSVKRFSEQGARKIQKDRAFPMIQSKQEMH